jgi:hypothetical protein
MPVDPFTVATGVASLIKTVGQAAIDIQEFGKTVHGAQKDVADIVVELASLETILNELEIHATDVTEGSRLEIRTESLYRVNLSINRCRGEVERLTKELKKYSGGKLKSLRWGIDGKRDIEKFRNNLEKEKAVLELANNNMSL